MSSFLGTCFGEALIGSTFGDLLALGSQRYHDKLSVEQLKWLNDLSLVIFE